MGVKTNDVDGYESVTRNDVKGTIKKIVKANDKWITAAQLEDVTDFRRQSINQAIRSLKDDDEVKVKKEIKDGFEVNMVKSNE